MAQLLTALATHAAALVLYPGLLAAAVFGGMAEISWLSLTTGGWAWPDLPRRRPTPVLATVLVCSILAGVQLAAPFNPVPSAERSLVVAAIALAFTAWAELALTVELVAEPRLLLLVQFCWLLAVLAPAVQPETLRPQVLGNMLVPALLPLKLACGALYLLCLPALLRLWPFAPPITRRRKWPQPEQGRQAEQVEGPARELQRKQGGNQHIAQDLRSQRLWLHSGREDRQQPAELRAPQQPRFSHKLDRERELRPGGESQRDGRHHQAALRRRHRVERCGQLHAGEDRAHEHRRRDRRGSPPRKVGPRPAPRREAQPADLGHAAKDGGCKQTWIEHQRGCMGGESCEELRHLRAPHKPARVSSGWGNTPSRTLIASTMATPTACRPRGTPMLRPRRSEAGSHRSITAASTSASGQ